MGKGNVQKAKTARERKQAAEAKAGNSGGGRSGMAQRKGTNDQMKNAQAEREAKRKAQAEAKAAKAAKKAAEEKKLKKQMEKKK
mmetsp:Transcript_35305/g.46603  ORF Transcript_35305/g.46603 Transcript_35305/m.46603 type:complete len:84 (+) Transcript_35305:205-456(+)|eukprot:CAMPEP_0117763894 /NCGR_PEP_ID=MMETSP0947-20121206/19008_1 /TAXON_ID=44440 /ORGANISM="Chattonella subsalsa, Strain CCMP2191" /LENGTH=83 /DNA_ID=CAMNT_0005585885 /DNA_START=191 /DNA_END=442 /DNA_ORIENTATION=+